MLEYFNMSKCSLVLTPLSPGLLLSIDNCPITSQEIEKMKKTPYHEVLGSLMQLQVATRPDLLYTIKVLSHFVHNPEKPYWLAFKHILTYIKDTTHYGLTYSGGSDLNSIGYVDLEYTGYKNTCRSTKGNIFVMVRGPISWKSKRQKIIALSTVEAEYIVFIKATTQALWLTLV